MSEKFLRLVPVLFLAGSQMFADQPIFVETYNVPITPCEGLALDGVSYSFTIGGAPSGDCNAGSLTGPGVTPDIQPPNIEGNAAGILHLTFDHPTTELDFGVAQLTGGPQPNSVIVDLYQPGVGTIRQEVFLSTGPDPLFSGGHFNYSGPAILSATIHFTGAYPRFALDNLSYFRPPGQSKQ